MSKASDALRSIGIFNPYTAVLRYVDATAAVMPPVIIYNPQQTGRAYNSASWQVHRPGFKTDPQVGVGNWRDYGHKTFRVLDRAEKAPQLEEAKAWASERYGVKEWVSIPGIRDDKFPAEVAAWVKQQLKGA